MPPVEPGVPLVVAAVALFMGVICICPAWDSNKTNEITLWKLEGERPFSVERGRTELNLIKEGTTITVELDKNDKVFDVRRALDITGGEG